MVTNVVLRELAKRWAGPLMVAPRAGKYYGTHVVDSAGNEVIEFWTAEGEPSEREKERFGPAWTPEAWSAYICDSHWECAADYEAALEFCRLSELLTQAATFT